MDVYSNYFVQDEQESEGESTESRSPSPQPKKRVKKEPKEKKEPKAPKPVKPKAKVAKKPKKGPVTVKCKSCQEITKVKNPLKVMMRNGGFKIEGSCMKCEAGISQFIKKQ